MTLSRYNVELRAEVKGDVLRGHASVFNQYADLGSHYEQMGDTSFDAVLADKSLDTRALFNHDPSFLLGRMSAGTLRLGTDRDGLEFEVDLPNTTVGRDVRELTERGDLTGASFGFIPGEDNWDKAPDGRKLRTHTSVRQLVDVSPVTFPAYEGTDIALRSMDFGPISGSRSRLILARHRVRFGTN
jgi:HK97 family phage prohead protease